MEIEQPSPTVKLEAPSLPHGELASLFPQATSSPSAATVNPANMTPEPPVDDQAPSAPATEPQPHPDTQASTAEMKASKKRKSWGQVLPETKTNLPPRKRAKTEEEKEQRRVERVLRNRRAAQSSRERKRLEVEALEVRNKELETLLLNAQKANLMLVEELNRFRCNSGVVTRSSSPFESLRDNPITLSQQLFGSQGELRAGPEPSSNRVGDLIMSSANLTVNPASLSPDLTPVPDLVVASATVKTEALAGNHTMAISPDLTQRPAEMLCDLRCHKSAEVARLLPVSRPPTMPRLSWILQLRMMLLSVSAILSACHRPLTQIAMSSKAGFSLLPTPQLLATIIWLVTLPPTSRPPQPLTYSTSTTSSTTRKTMPPQILWQRAMAPPRTTASSPQSMTLRFKSLRKILSSSPNLARPLTDATMEALRLVSQRCDDRVGHWGTEPRATCGENGQLTHCLRGINLLSREVLVTLLWALRFEKQRLERRGTAPLGNGRGIPKKQPIRKYILKVSSPRGGRVAGDGFIKRLHMA